LYYARERERSGLSFGEPTEAALTPLGRKFFSDVQPKEARNKDYDDHDTDDVKNIHYTLPLSHAFQKKARCSKG